MGYILNKFSGNSPTFWCTKMDSLHFFYLNIVKADEIITWHDNNNCLKLEELILFKKECRNLSGGEEEKETDQIENNKPKLMFFPVNAGNIFQHGIIRQRNGISFSAKKVSFIYLMTLIDFSYGQSTLLRVIWGYIYKLKVKISFNILSYLCYYTINIWEIWWVETCIYKGENT